MTHSPEGCTHTSREHPKEGALDPDSPPRERAIEHVRAHAERIKRRELETALTKLDGQGDLTRTQRETVARMADALVTELVAPPTQALRASQSPDRPDVRTALELFDPDSSPDEGRY